MVSVRHTAGGLGWRFFSPLLCALCIAYSAEAAAPPPVNIERATTPIAHIADAEAPTIDGDVSDSVWAKATLIDQFYQQEPDYGDAPTEKTELRLAYDSNNLYIYLYAYDDEPDLIVATQKIRDGMLSNDDRIKILIDPNLTRRDAYSFEVNSLGGYTDALLQNNSQFFINWDIIWHAAGKRVANGWTAEMAIPFRSLSFDPASNNWGFDFFRVVKRKDEQIRWSRQPIGTDQNDVTYSGTLTGLSGMSQGSGLDVQVYGSVRYKHQSIKTPDDDITFFPSANLFYKVTPSLTGTLTANTDFSDAPLDPRQVNTTRFSLFVQETRQFFLQDAASYEFGGRGFATSQGGFGQPGFENNGRPFFSRNIGLVNGAPVNIALGGKLSGEQNGVNIGALAVKTAGTDTQDGQLLSVLRLTTPVFSQAKLGAIITNGDPSGLTRNTVAGADFQYLNPSLFGSGKRFQSDFYYLNSNSSKLGEDSEFGASFLFPNEPIGGEFHFKQIGKDFAPALGFVNRKGIDDYRGRIVYRQRYRNSWLRYYDLATDHDIITNLGGHLQSRNDRVSFIIFTDEGDTFELDASNLYEDVETSFKLPNGVPIPPDQYNYYVFKTRIATSRTRPLAATLNFECCGYYNGFAFRTNSMLSWRPNETWDIFFQHQLNIIEVPAGRIQIHIVSLDLTTNFTPDMTLRTGLQYDNISQRFQLLARYKWQYEPGQELFVSIGENSLIDGPVLEPNYHPNTTLAQIRIGHTFQF